MKTLIMSYSFTGNNEAFARRFAEELNAEHISIREIKNRTIGTIIADFVFRRTPKTEPDPQLMSSYDLIIFMAPVWMGQPAFPLKLYLKQLNKHQQKYAFVSICGYANSGLPKALMHIASYEASAVIEQYIADLLPSNSKPTPQSISNYKLTEQDVEKMVKQATSILKDKNLI